MKKIWIAGIIILVVGLAVVLQMRKKGNGKPAADQVVTATTGPIAETIEATGEVAPLNRVEIKPPISGRVEDILADEGDIVKAGQTIAWMSSSDRAAIMDAARAQGADQAKRWQDIYKPTPVVAPLAGTLILKNIVVGQTVDASTVLFAMSDRLIVAVSVDEADIGRVQNGQQALITLDAYPDQTINGTVFQILHEGKNVSNVITYIVKVVPDRIPSYFRSQMTANVRLIVKSADDAVLVPTGAIREGSNGEKSVLVMKGPNQVEERPIQTGIQTSDSTQVTQGISAGERILISRAKYTPQKAMEAANPLMPGSRRPSSANTPAGGSSSARQGRTQRQ
jgi:macrolide-specific efflux system membrane fusion protein